MSKEGSTQAPTRHPLKFRDPDFINPEKIDQEMRRVFDICHGCRRCFNLCDSFPKLFDYIDETEGGEVSDLSSDKFKPVGLVTAAHLSAPIQEFELEVTQIFSDKFSAWQFGQIDFQKEIQKISKG